MELNSVQAIVTGAASGLGRRFALELARAGAGVVAGDLDEAGLLRLEVEAANLPGSVATLPLDVGHESAVKGFVEEAFGRLPGINTLVNNAGVLLDGVLVKKEPGWTRRLPAGQWKRVLDVNLTGTYLMTREVVAAMLERDAGGGLVVNISSLARAGNVGQSAYSASKAGIDAATRSWALELAEYGIRVAAIAPGVIRTPILENVSGAAREALLSHIPAGRFGEADEVWKALRFIIETEFFNGKILEVDGGAIL